MAFGKGNLKGKNNMKDWLNPTTAYENPQATRPTNLVGSVTGSGWIVSLSTRDSSVNIALTVDGSPYLGNNQTDEAILVQAGSLIMKRYESGFSFYSDTASENVLIYVEGDKFEDCVTKVLTDLSGLTANANLLSLTGEGWFYGGGSGNRPITLNIDGVDVILNRTFVNELSFLSKFKNSLTIKTDIISNNQNYHYTLLP